MGYEATAIGQARRARIAARLERRRSREARRRAVEIRATNGTMESAGDTCWFVPCADPASVEAVGTWDRVCGIEQTIALALCRRHADALRDELLLLETA
jgi:hypothetical protein